MVDFLLKHKPNTLLYILCSPWILLLFSPFIKLPVTNIQKAIIILFIIIWIQGSLLFYITFGIGKRLIKKEGRRFNCITLNIYFLHCLLDYLMFTISLFIIIQHEITPVNTFMVEPLLILFIILETLRLASFSKLMVSLEFGKRARFIEYLGTVFLMINPFIGIWNLHSRIVYLMKN